ncbi:MAG: hypothetical protein KBG28_25075 [Kofleriaceae bacterium]|nr:hypothetical protein [Kofleriaceae bacterium]MBP6840038.1 hypothetical protein [Kofleriaceae bacterium]MBP9207266.1 hypothetical protein [Kofleriaceae bacterium]
MKPSRLLALGVLSLSLGLGLAACSKSKPADTIPPGGGGGGDTQLATCPEGSTPQSDTDPAQCTIAKGCCFPSAEAACAAEGCGMDVCQLLESMPPQASCPAADVQPPVDGDQPTSSGAAE